MKNASEVPQKNSPLAGGNQNLVGLWVSWVWSFTTGLCKQPKYNRQLQKDGYAGGKCYVIAFFNCHLCRTF
jgi:hypothetical protein